jgi:hypothetical protein
MVTTAGLLLILTITEVNDPASVTQCSGNMIDQVSDAWLRTVCQTDIILQGLLDAGTAVWAQHKHPPQLILVILPQSAADVRLRVKRWGDVARGVATQCVVRGHPLVSFFCTDRVFQREGKIYKNSKYLPNDQYCNNVAIK